MRYNSVQLATRPMGTRMINFSKIRDAFDKAAYNLFGYETMRARIALGVKEYRTKLIIEDFACNPQKIPPPKVRPRLEDINWMPVKQWVQQNDDAFADELFHAAIERATRKKLICNVPPSQQTVG